jgi:hypothetical protein
LTARYLKIRSGGSNMHFWRGKYGPKMISCSVTAYADTNASKEEEIIPMCEYLMLILLRWIFCKGPVTISLERWIKNSLHHISPPAR